MLLVERVVLWQEQWVARLTTWLAWKLPRRLAYWAAVRVAIHNVDEYPGDRTVFEILEGWWK